MHTGSRHDPWDRSKIVKRIKEVIREVLKCCGDIDEIILFGSYARGEAKETSSMDILIIAKSDLPFIERIKRVIELVSENSIPVEPLVYTPEEIRQKLGEGSRTRSTVR